MSQEFDRRKELEEPVVYRVPGRWVTLEEPRLVEVRSTDGSVQQRSVNKEFVPAVQVELEEIRGAITEEDESVMLEVLGNPPEDLVCEFGGALLMFLEMDVLGHFRKNDPRLASIAEKTKGIGVWTNSLVPREDALELVTILRQPLTFPLV